MLKKVLKKIGSIFSYILIALEAIFILFTLISRINNGIPSVFGYNIFVIGSGSMQPELQVGDVILSKEVTDTDVLNVNDIVTYQGEVGDMAGKIITHRVIKINDDGTLVTKGDNNTSRDPTIEKRQVYSVMVCKCFVIGFMYKILSTIWGFLIFLVAPLVYLIISETINLAKARVEGENENEK